jgi:Na+/melibiose symporter-like transporter
VVACFGVAAVLLLAFAIVEARAKNPMLPMRFFRERDFTGAVLVIGIVLFAMFVTFFFLTQFFQLVQGRSAFEAGLLIVPTSIAMIISSGLAARLIHAIGPRLLALAMTGAMTIGLVLLMALTPTSTTFQIIAALVIFGFGAGLGLPALTDTVMAAVPERDAGVGSAVNDVSRQLGGALGVAVIGSIVNSAYRHNLGQALGRRLPSTVLQSAGRSIGVATQVARTLPGGLATTLTHAANRAFVDAMTGGFVISAAVMIASITVAATMLPRQMRKVQAAAEDDEAARAPKPVSIAGIELEPVGPDRTHRLDPVAPGRSRRSAGLGR